MKFTTRVALITIVLHLLSTSLTADNNQIIRVMTYNIHHCNPPAKKGVIDTDAIAAVIINSGAHIVLLQEVDVNTSRSGSEDQAQILSRKSSLDHHFFYKAIDFSGGDYGVAILSRFPLKDYNLYPLSNEIPSERRVLGSATVEIAEGIRILLANTHLDLEEGNRVQQVYQLDTILKNSEYPVILGGDFNALPDSGEIKSLNNSFTGWKGVLHHTFPDDNPNRTIDYLFLRNAPKEKSVKYTIKFIDYKVITGVNASDHLPLIADILLTVK